jgi:hypothetical protein
MATSGFDPVRGRLQELFEVAPDESLSDLCNADHRLIAVNRERHKDDLLLAASHTVAAEGHAVDAQFDSISRSQFLPPAGFPFAVLKIVYLALDVHQNHFPLQPNDILIRLMPA